MFSCMFPQFPGDQPWDNFIVIRVLSRSVAHELAHGIRVEGGSLSAVVGLLDDLRLTIRYANSRVVATGLDQVTRADRLACRRAFGARSRRPRR